MAPGCEDLKRRITVSIRIIVDSACDISQESAKELDITVLPMTISFDDEEFLDGVTLSTEQFFEKLVETDVLPKTSQLPPHRYEEVFEQVKAAGDQAICITLSSKLSGCYQSANIAVEDFEDCMTIVDSENVCIGEQILVLLAVRLRDEGKSVEEIVEILNEQKKKVCLIALLDTLEYLKKGGRISKAVAAAGSLLSIKPVISLQDGEIALVGKARGSRNGNNLLIRYVEENGPIRFDMPFCLAYSGLSRTLLDKYIADSSALYRGIDLDQIPVCGIGSAIGTHAGPGAVAVAFFAM
jgi:DegV family protein with EDD domain